MANPHKPVTRQHPNSEELHTEGPISEKDEVKNAEKNSARQAKAATAANLKNKAGNKNADQQ